MDLGAYAQIDDLSAIMKENNISVERLRGLRLMANEEPISDEKIEEQAAQIGFLNCESLCEANFVLDPWSFELSSRTNQIKKKYLIKNEEGSYVGVHWDRIHGKKRKAFKYVIKSARKRVWNNLSIFNKYCGRNDVLYIHARIGGGNWAYYGGSKITEQPWFLERVDDPFDGTYCDIYAKIKPIKGEEEK